MSEGGSDEAIHSSLCGALDCFASLAMTLLEVPLRQKADHRVGENVRLFDIGNMRGVENGETGAGNLAADEFAGRDRGCHVVASGDHQGRAVDLPQQRTLVERRERFAAGEIAFYWRRR